MLSAEESRHALKVLRLQEKERVRLLDGKGTLAEAEMLPPEGRLARCRILSRTQQEAESPSWQLYVAPPRGRNFESLLRVAVEFGVSRVVPVLCRYAVARPEQSSDHWRAALISAAKQAINPRLPEVPAPQAFSLALAAAPQPGFVGAPGGVGRPLREMVPALAACRQIAIWIGPEGGFSDFEMQALEAAGVQPITIGNHVLRIETAMPALLAYLRAGLELARGFEDG